MQAIINGEMYEVEPAVKVILDRVMCENAKLKRENKRLEESYQKATGVIAAQEWTVIQMADEYISKQSVIDYLNGYLHSIGEYNPLFDMGQRRALTNAIQDISAIKAADVQPVKHGHWITDDSKIYLKHKCSECGHAVILKYPYCENCGAEMDGGADNETD